MSLTVTRITAGRPWPTAEDPPLTAARKLVARGLMICPVDYRHKEPPRGWQKKRIDESNVAEYFDDEIKANIGVMMGRRSGHLVDVNLQSTEAIILAPRVLPSTLMFGRQSHPCSHALYYADHTRSLTWLDPDTGYALLEIRADLANGEPTHTIFPPSVHEESGERITFEPGPVEPFNTTADALHGMCAELAASCVLLRRWKDVPVDGLIGALVRAGWDAPRVMRFLKPIAGDDITPAQISAVVERHVDGQPVAGWPTVEKGLGPKHTKAIETWLNARAKATRGNFTTRPVRDMVPDAPARGLIVPHGYALGTDETVTTDPNTGDDVVIAPAPIIITGRVVGEIEKVRLTWRQGDAWRSTICERRTAMVAARLLDLTNERFPVGTATSNALAEYLRLFEAANAREIPTARETQQLGWQGTARFLWGSTLIDARGRTNADLTEVDPADWPADALSFSALSEGDKKFAQAFRQRGTLAGWQTNVRRAAYYPLVMSGVYASFIPVFMGTLGIHNFIMSWSCTTSHGKTSAMRLAASAWGDPNDESPDGSIIGRWNATRVGVEARCAMSNGLPLFIDDTKQARKKEWVESAVYDVSSAATGTRGERAGGTRKVNNFRTILFTTGEAALDTFAAEGSGGARARTVELSDPPWGEANERTLPVVNAINAGAFAHHGVAGPMFVEWWLHQQPHWEAHKVEHERTRALYADLATSGEEARMLDYVAAIDTASRLLQLAGILDCDQRPTLSALTKAVQQEAQEVRPDSRALEHLWEWTVAHPQEFYGRHRVQTGSVFDQDIQPAKGWAGKWDDSVDWQHIDYSPNRLKEILKEGGFDSKQALKAWDRSGVLVKGDGRLTTVSRIADVPARVHRITRTGLFPQFGAVTTP